jgi:hypothetical protein
MSLFHIVHAEMIHDLEQGYGSWLRQSNRERATFGDELLEDNDTTRRYFLDCIGFFKAPYKMSLRERLSKRLRER